MAPLSEGSSGLRRRGTLRCVRVQAARHVMSLALQLRLRCAQDMRGTGDLKMSQILASAFGEVVKSDGRVDEKELSDLLKKMPVSIGAGKQTVRSSVEARMYACHMHRVILSATVASIRRVSLA